jgi:integrase
VLAEIAINGPLSGPHGKAILSISSDASVKAARLGEHTVTGAQGLILRVHASKTGAVTRTWILRATDGGRRRRMGLGQYPGVSLAQARQKATDARRAVAEGIDPSITAKRRQRAAVDARSLTLMKAIDGWLAQAALPFKNVKSDRIRERALRVHFAPLHHRDVATITATDVAGILRPLAPETASKAHSVIRSIFDFAATALEPHGVVIINPADPRRLRSVGWAPRSKGDSKPHAAVDWRVMPSVAAKLERMEDVAAACALFIAATAVRAGTARLAKWSDINLDQCIWTPPLVDLKDGKHHKRPFIAPLNDVALDVLECMRARASSRYVFANAASGPIGENAITGLVRKLHRCHDDWRDPHTGKPFTVHGFRASFRTWVEDVRRNDGSLAELTLGHRVHGEVAARYIRTGLVEERRALLGAWSHHLRGETAKVLTLNRR